MFRTDIITTTADESNWAEPRSTRGDGERHREIDRALRRIAAMHCGLDVEEARWLRVAEAEGTWKRLGYVHGLEYLEDVFGYRPRTAKDRLRVARELGELPELEEALAAGELSYSVVRELTRVATPANVARWIEDARGKNLRDVEHMVSGRRKGDDPDDAPDPTLVDHDILIELDAERVALWRDLRKGLEDELGRSLDDKELVAEIHARVFTSPVANEESASSEQAGRPQAPRRMIHISTCRDCRRAWQDGAGVPMQIDGLVVDRVECDAIICDDDRETRAEPTIPERIRRKVFERDGYKCTFPGCRSSRNLAIHHIRHRANGGTHDPSNLTTQCDGHHGLHHDGLITISGQAPDALVFTRHGQPIGMPAATAGSLSPQVAVDAAATPGSVDPETRSLAKAALTQAGYRAAIAKRAVDVACAHVGTGADLTTLIKEALKHCG